MQNSFFKIFRIGVPEAEKIAAATDNEPHAHDYEELLIGMNGGLEHFIDFRSELFEAPYVSFIAMGKVHKLVPVIRDGECSVWVIRFRTEFIPDLAFQLYSLFHDDANIVMKAGRSFTRLVTVCEIMDSEMQQENPDFAVIRQLLISVFTMIESDRKKASQAEDPVQISQNVTFRNFLRILEENFRRPAGVRFYAEKLFMTSRNLNIICNSIMQQSVSEIIENRKLTEAKNLLISTGKTVSEISYELGYNEKSYFSNVFRKKTGQTPGEFRREMRKLSAF